LQLLQKLRDTLARMDPDKLTPGQRKQMQSEVAAILAKSAVLFGDEQGQAAIGRLTALGGLGRLLAGKKG
jgi:hypothetical protein